MILENRYGLSPDQLNKMVKDGVIPCVVKNHYEVYEQIQTARSACPSCSLNEVFRKVEESTKVEFASVKKIFYTLGKTL